MEFRDFYELAAKVTEYEELLKEESYLMKKSMGTYRQEVNQEVASGRSIYYRDIHLSFFGRKST